MQEPSKTTVPHSVPSLKATSAIYMTLMKVLIKTTSFNTLKSAFKQFSALRENKLLSAKSQKYATFSFILLQYYDLTKIWYMV